jgi:RNA polymerase sigma-70 factor (ECF subfamily)
VYVSVSIDGAVASSHLTAYDGAYLAHWHDVFRFALAWTNDWGAAEDLAQETFVRLWGNRKKLDWERDLLPWLLVTTRRLATDRFRTLRRRLIGPPAPATLDQSTAERWLDVQEALSVLSPLERTSLLLTTVGDRDYAEVATLLSISQGSARAAVSRARKKLEADT